MLDLYTKPKVGDITGWYPVYTSGEVEWHLAENHRAFHRVKVAGKKARYFYGEMAYHEARAAAADADFAAWRAGR